MKKIVNPIIIILLAIILQACATKKLVLESNIQNSQLGVCLEYADIIDEKTQAAFNNSLKNLIEQYNNNADSIKLTHCNNPSQQAIVINVLETDYVGPQEQALWTTVSLLGIAVPPLLFDKMLGFVFFQNNETTTELTLSSDLSSQEKIKRKFHTWPFYGNIEKQRNKQSKKFAEFVEEIVQQLELSHS